MTTKLSERVRPNYEAAPWVVIEIKRLEVELENAKIEIDELKAEIRELNTD